MTESQHRGERIAYERFAGPTDAATVVLQHGLLSRKETWAQTGYVAAFTDRYHVITVDSLGHGDSDKPHDAALYGRQQRAGDVVSVLEAENVDQAHFIGYSMGGWIGSGMAVFHPERLLSLTIGGWDPIGGVASVPGAGTFDDLLEGARTAAPALTQWVTDDVKPGLSACWDALRDVAGSADAIAALSVPFLLWCGQDDPYIEPVRRFAAEGGYPVHEVPGDHVGARMIHGEQSASGLRAFLDSV